MDNRFATHQKIVQISWKSDRFLLVLSVKKYAHCVMSLPLLFIFYWSWAFLKFCMPALLSLCFIFNLLLKLNRKDYSEKNYIPICARQFSSSSETFSAIWEFSFFSEIFVRPTLFVRHGWLVLQMALLLLFPWRYLSFTILIDVPWMWVNFNSLVQLAEIEFVPKVKKWKLKFLSRLSDMQHFWLIKFRLCRYLLWWWYKMTGYITRFFLKKFTVHLYVC